MGIEVGQRENRGKKKMFHKKWRESRIYYAFGIVLHWERFQVRMEGSRFLFRLRKLSTVWPETSHLNSLGLRVCLL